MFANPNALLDTDVVAAKLLSFDQPSSQNAGVARSVEATPAKNRFAQAERNASPSPIKQPAVEPARAVISDFSLVKRTLISSKKNKTHLLFIAIKRQ